jgi:hypothetical protein
MGVKNKTTLQYMEETGLYKEEKNKNKFGHLFKK